MMEYTHQDLNDYKSTLNKEMYLMYVYYKKKNSYEIQLFLRLV